MTNFFLTPAENADYDVWKQKVLDATSHGWLPSDTYLLQVYVEGRTIDQVAYDADFDYEELAFRD